MRSSLSRMDRIFSLFVVLAIILLAAYMLVRIATQGYMFIEHVALGHYFDLEFMEVHSRRALHAIAEVIVLIKAYRILSSYVVSHHVSVEYIVEISIIASAVELLFAIDAHSTATNIVLGIFGLTNLFFYLHYFGPDHDEDLHKKVRSHKK